MAVELEPRSDSGYRPGQQEKVASTEEIIEAVLFYRGVVFSVARHFKVSRRTVYNWMHADEEIAEAFAAARLNLEDEAENKLIQALQRSEPWAVKYILSRAERRTLTDKPMEVRHRHEGTVAVEVSEHDRLASAAQVISLFAALGIPLPGTARVALDDGDPETDEIYPALPAPETGGIPPSAG